ncbi:glycosyltransferase [Starkeya sp. 3C]|uniref:Glycosyltransferase n=1 Tax=Ancylobacter moscoviensis TaxID=2597768 RepID=A0ABY3DVJ9_9HYPH|nr:glycosyltransferase [Ancylobacter moscoviensis]TSJ64180.1 glycosyltransferase [Ancylobacter moscoviensis]
MTDGAVSDVVAGRQQDDSPPHEPDAVRQASASDALPGAGKGAPGFGFDVVGYLLSEIGLGEATRLLVAALDAADIPTALINAPLPGRESDERLLDRLTDAGRHDIALSVFGLLDVGIFAARSSRNRIRIGYPFWELPTAPASIRPDIERFDAYWAPSTFIRDMLAREQNRPVHLVRQPVRLPPPPPAAPVFEGPLRILSFFDYDSVMARKNPLGAVRAFLSAFPAGSEDVQLVIKARGAPQPEAAQQLRALTAGDRRITIIDETISRTRMDGLIAGCHVFLSLHRSEGFGLGCAEALASGKIVVATDFGGTRDFITPITGYPVAYHRVRLSAGDYPDAAGSYWAEPDVSHAALILRSIYDRPDDAAARIGAGHAHLKAHHSFEAVGARLRELRQEMC